MATLTAQLDFKIERAYEPASANDGARVLVDRLWLRGVTKEKAAIVHWFRDLAPSTELRQWFGHDVARGAELQRWYAAKLKYQADQLDELCRLARCGAITLVFRARDEEHNAAIVLKQALLERSEQ